MTFPESAFYQRSQNFPFMDNFKVEGGHGEVLQGNPLKLQSWPDPHSWRDPTLPLMNSRKYHSLSDFQHFHVFRISPDDGGLRSLVTPGITWWLVGRWAVMYLPGGGPRPDAGQAALLARAVLARRQPEGEHRAPLPARTWKTDCLKIKMFSTSVHGGNINCQSCQEWYFLVTS